MSFSQIFTRFNQNIILTMSAASSIIFYYFQHFNWGVQLHSCVTGYGLSEFY